MKVFERPGPANTGAVIDLLAQAAPAYEYLVMASITGASAVHAAEACPGKHVVCVTCPQGMNWEVGQMQDGPFAEIPELRQIRDEWMQRGLQTVPMGLTPENKLRLEKRGVPVIQGTIPLFGPSFSMRLHLNHVTSLDIVAKTLELISTGTLVCLECVLMAVDAGIVPEGAHVLAAAGTECGLDTAWVIRGSASANLFHPVKGARFVELLCKPGISQPPDINIDYLR